MNISENEYKNAKNIVERYETEQRRLAKYNGKSRCPFCSGTKVKPFVRAFSNQNCTDCNKDGMISNRTLAQLGLEDEIGKQPIDYLKEFKTA